MIYDRCYHVTCWLVTGLFLPVHTFLSLIFVLLLCLQNWGPYHVHFTNLRRVIAENFDTRATVAVFSERDGNCDSRESRFFHIMRQLRQTLYWICEFRLVTRAPWNDPWKIRSIWKTIIIDEVDFKCRVLLNPQFESWMNDDNWQDAIINFDLCLSWKMWVIEIEMPAFWCEFWQFLLACSFSRNVNACVCFKTCLLSDWNLPDSAWLCEPNVNEYYSFPTSLSNAR